MLSDLVLVEINQIHHLHVVNEFQVTMKEIGSKQQTEIIRRWLAPADSSTNANHARELRHEGTGQWFLESPVFQEWTSGSRRSLWLHGLPGFGKTVLLTTAYDHIVKEPERVALQFFFDFGHDRKQTLDNMLRELVFQLYSRQARPSSELDDLFNRYNNGRNQPDSDSLSDCLQKMLKSSHKTYIFIDALDECSERMKLLKWMESFVALPDLDHVRLIMTARPETDFNQRIPSMVHERNCVSIQTKSMSADIESYVQSSLRDRAGFKKWISTPSVLQKISSKLGERSGGM